jgi:hypothetical protein
MMLVVDQEQLVARPGLGQADAARVTRRPPVGDPSHRAPLCELLVGQGEQMRKPLGRRPVILKSFMGSPLHVVMERI